MLVEGRKKPPAQVAEGQGDKLEQDAATGILRVHGKKFNGMPLGKLQLLAAACIPMAAVQVLTSCNLHVLARSHCNLHCWSFSMTN